MTSQTASARDAIAAANKAFMSAFERADPAGIAALHTEDGQVLPPGFNTVAGKEDIGAFWKGAMDAGVKRVELITLELDTQGETAIEVGHARLFDDAGDFIEKTRYLVVWKREKGQWRIHRDLWNSEAPAE